jgi:hypothetical protein
MVMHECYNRLNESAKRFVIFDGILGRVYTKFSEEAVVPENYRRYGVPICEVCDHYPAVIRPNTCPYRYIDTSQPTN